MEAEYAAEDAVLLAACEIHRGMSSGPGGQHANRTHSAVRLLHCASGVQAQCQDHRQQQRNQQEALRRLRLRLALRQRGVSREAWLQPFRQGRRLQVAPGNARYHLVVAVLFDALDQAQGHLATAAQALQCSSSQLVKVLSCDKEVMHAAQELVARHGAHPLRTR
ncbi:MAG: peptide chain release factor-like protein [Planctomycetota bacterium]|nr:MAG: peptide chain release factor-like protein [Planctomycetota bacterium]